LKKRKKLQIWPQKGQTGNTAYNAEFVTLATWWTYSSGVYACCASGCHFGSHHLLCW